MAEKTKTYSELENELNEIISKLSNKDISLDEQISLYKNAKEIIKLMQEKLDEFKKAIE